MSLYPSLIKSVCEQVYIFSLTIFLNELMDVTFLNKPLTFIWGNYSHWFRRTYSLQPQCSIITKNFITVAFLGQFPFINFPWNPFEKLVLFFWRDSLKLTKKLVSVRGNLYRPYIFCKWNLWKPLSDFDFHLIQDQLKKWIYSKKKFVIWNAVGWGTYICWNSLLPCC